MTWSALSIGAVVWVVRWTKSAAPTPEHIPTVRGDLLHAAIWATLILFCIPAWALIAPPVAVLLQYLPAAVLLGVCAGTSCGGRRIADRKRR